MDRKPIERNLCPLLWFIETLWVPVVLGLITLTKWNAIDIRPGEIDTVCGEIDSCELIFIIIIHQCCQMLIESYIMPSTVSTFTHIIKWLFLFKSNRILYPDRYEEGCFWYKYINNDTNITLLIKAVFAQAFVSN